MIYTYVNVWRDGERHLAYEIPHRTFIGDSRAPPMLVRPTAHGHSDPETKEWRGVIDYLVSIQDDSRFTISEGFNPWDNHGWPIERVRP